MGDKGNESALDVYDFLPDFEWDKEFKNLQDDHNAIQKKCEDLQKRIDKLNEEKARLDKQNEILQRNISVLLVTAKKELARKDQIIEELRRELSKYEQMKHKKFDNGHERKNKKRLGRNDDSDRNSEQTASKRHKYGDGYGSRLKRSCSPGNDAKAPIKIDKRRSLEGDGYGSSLKRSCSPGNDAKAPIKIDKRRSLEGDGYGNRLKRSCSPDNEAKAPIKKDKRHSLEGRRSTHHVSEISSKKESSHHRQSHDHLSSEVHRVSAPRGSENYKKNEISNCMKDEEIVEHVSMTFDSYGCKTNCLESFKINQSKEDGELANKKKLYPASIETAEATDSSSAELDGTVNNHVEEPELNWQTAFRKKNRAQRSRHMSLFSQRMAKRLKEEENNESAKKIEENNESAERKDETVGLNTREEFSIRLLVEQEEKKETETKVGENNNPIVKGDKTSVLKAKVEENSKKIMKACDDIEKPIERIEKDENSVPKTKVDENTETRMIVDIDVSVTNEYENDGGETKLEECNLIIKNQEENNRPIENKEDNGAGGDPVKFIMNTISKLLPTNHKPTIDEIPSKELFHNIHQKGPSGENICTSHGNSVHRPWIDESQEAIGRRAHIAEDLRPNKTFDVVQEGFVKEKTVPIEYSPFKNAYKLIELSPIPKKLRGTLRNYRGDNMGQELLPSSKPKTPNVDFVVGKPNKPLAVTDIIRDAVLDEQQLNSDISSEGTSGTDRNYKLSVGSGERIRSEEIEESKFNSCSTVISTTPQNKSFGLNEKYLISEKDTTFDSVEVTHKSAIDNSSEDGFKTADNKITQEKGEEEPISCYVSAAPLKKPFDLTKFRIPKKGTKSDNIEIAHKSVTYTNSEKEQPKSRSRSKIVSPSRKDKENENIKDSKKKSRSEESNCRKVNSSKSSSDSPFDTSFSKRSRNDGKKSSLLDRRRSRNSKSSSQGTVDLPPLKLKNSEVSTTKCEGPNVKKGKPSSDSKSDCESRKSIKTTKDQGPVDGKSTTKSLEIEVISRVETRKSDKTDQTSGESTANQQPRDYTVKKSNPERSTDHLIETETLPKITELMSSSTVTPTTPSSSSASDTSLDTSKVELNLKNYNESSIENGLSLNHSHQDSELTNDLLLSESDDGSSLVISDGDSDSEASDICSFL